LHILGDTVPASISMRFLLYAHLEPKKKLKRDSLQL